VTDGTIRPAAPPSSVSVLILTLNEEINIRDCIASLSWSDDVIILDSYSTDATVQMAAELGARVYQRKFDNWAAHQNWAVSNLPFKHPWVLYLDADERCPDDLREEVCRLATPEAAESAFRVRRKDYFMGRWLRHAQLYPSWFTRLFRPLAISYDRLVNPVATVNGITGTIDSHITHYPFSHGIGHWIDRHNRYSAFEAMEMFKIRNGAVRTPGSIWSHDPAERRRALKDIFFRMPVRPWVKFGYYYFARRGFLDGHPGLTYSALQAIYEYFIDCQYRELVRREQGQSL
jgi:glycosyltransferase involved in cell wall biosynthesis